MRHDARSQRWEQAGKETADVAIVGGGINGACLYHRLCQQGYRVLLLDKGDFASGTSQASAMMVWGGLLYLRNLDFPAVCHFSKARETMISKLDEWVSPRCFRYVPAVTGGRNKHLVHAALYLYWALGRFHRQRPYAEPSFAEDALIREQNHSGSLVYEEATLRDSDSRFVLQWITQAPDRGNALNYTAVHGGAYDGAERCWRLELENRLSGEQQEARARVVVNCAGVWTDELNRRFAVEAPYKHVMSKGVYLLFARPQAHEFPLIFEQGEYGDTLTLVPWGPVSLWGPTETAIPSAESGFVVNADDVCFLLEHLGRHLEPPMEKRDILGFRCGTRPLAVRRNFHRDCYPLDLSRRSRVARDPERPWISTYGGKVTGCLQLAERIAMYIHDMTPGPTAGPPASPPTGNGAPRQSFPGLDQTLPAIDWCRDNEYCCTLEDYLRRRTNIAQWVPRGGLGEDDANSGELQRLALALHGGNTAAADSEFERYRSGVNTHFDTVLAAV